MTQLFSPLQVSQAIGVSESTLKRWCDQGLLKAIRTCGGHRRIPLAEILAFLRNTEQTLTRPDVLGIATADIPSECVAAKESGIATHSRKALYEALISGDEQSVRSSLISLYLSGWSLARIGDDLIAPMLAAVGEAWECGDIEVFQERRGCQIIACVLRELRSMLPAGNDAGPTAIGASLSGDNYELPSTLAELVLRERGWKAQSMGVGLPPTTFCAAIRQMRPKLAWLSVSAIAEFATFREDFTQIVDCCKSNNVVLAAGGRALQSDVRKQLPMAAFCESMAHLEQFCDSLWQREPQNVPRIFKA